jgi:glycosyltransferase involved in cell wall biosynthesis
MRICHLLETAGGGSGRVVLDLIEAGLAWGDEIVLLFAPSRAEASFLADMRRFGRSIKVRAVPMRRSVGPWDLWSLFQIVRALLAFGPFDVIHSHSSKAGALARLARPFARSAVQVYTPHAFVTLAPSASPFYRWVERLLAPLADAIVCVSAREKEHAEHVLHVPAERLFLVPNGTRRVETSARAQARARLGIPETTVAIGFVGRMVLQKNPLRAAGAFLAQAQRFLGVELFFLGEGVLRAEVEARVSAEGAAPRVHWLPDVASADVMAGFDVLLASSDYEGLPLVFLEALASGVPIVSTPVGGVEECVHEGVTGFTADDYSESALAEALGRFLALSATERTAMGRQARLLGATYTLGQCAEKTREVYGVCLQRRFGRNAESLAA